MPASPALLQQIISNGIAELMYGLLALAQSSSASFEERKAGAIRGAAELSSCLQTAVTERAPVGAPALERARDCATALENALATAGAGDPMPENVHAAFAGLLEALQVAPQPSLHDLIAGAASPYAEPSPAPPEKLAAVLQVLEHAILRLRLIGCSGETDGIPPERAHEVVALADAVHNLPRLVQHWAMCDESLLRRTLEAFDDQYPESGSLLAIYDRVLGGAG